MTTAFLIIYEFEVRTNGDTLLQSAELHAQGERLMEALLDLEKCNKDVTDSATASEADRGVIVVELHVMATDPGEAIGKFLTVARTAIHAIGGATPGWGGTLDPTVEYEPRKVQLEYV